MNHGASITRLVTLASQPKCPVALQRWQKRNFEFPKLKLWTITPAEMSSVFSTFTLFHTYYFWVDMKSTLITKLCRFCSTFQEIRWQSWQWGQRGRALFDISSDTGVIDRHEWRCSGWRKVLKWGQSRSTWTTQPPWFSPHTLLTKSYEYSAFRWNFRTYCKFHHF